MTPSVTSIITPATSQALVDLASVKAEIGIASGDTANDALLTSWIARASAAASNFCNRVFVQETVEDTFFADRDPYPYQVPGGLEGLQLARWPVSEIVSVSENKTALVSGTDYSADLPAGTLWRLASNGFRISWPAYNVVVRYTSGYSTIPFDVQDACIRLVWSRWWVRERGDPMMRSEDIPEVRRVEWWVDTSAQANAAMSQDVIDLLDNYRVPVVI